MAAPLDHIHQAAPAIDGRNRSRQSEASLP
jgi:hypothetical protein